MRRKTWLTAALLGVGLVVTVAVVPSEAQYRWVSVNGQVLSQQELMMWEQLLGSPIPSGNYWVNPQTLEWGVIGDPRVRGRLGYARSPNVTGPGYNRRTPGGDLMSDGRCSFIAGVPVGNC
jgi:hypothetical protein